MKLFNLLFGKNKNTEKNIDNERPISEKKIKREISRQYTFEEIEEAFERNAVIIKL